MYTKPAIYIYKVRPQAETSGRTPPHRRRRRRADLMRKLEPGQEVTNGKLHTWRKVTNGKLDTRLEVTNGKLHSCRAGAEEE